MTSCTLFKQEIACVDFSSLFANAEISVSCDMWFFLGLLEVVPVVTNSTMGKNPKHKELSLILVFILVSSIRPAVTTKARGGLFESNSVRKGRDHILV